VSQHDATFACSAEIGGDDASVLSRKRDVLLRRDERGQKKVARSALRINIRELYISARMN